MVSDNQKIQDQSQDAPSKGLYGSMPSGYTVRPQGSGAMPTGYAIPPTGYGALPQAYGADPLKGPASSAPPPAYGAPFQAPQVVQAPIYVVAPPPTCACMRNGHGHQCQTTHKPPPKKPESDCERFFTACCGALLFCCIMDAIF